MNRKVTALALCLMMLVTVASAENCSICGGDGVCDACVGKGYQLMQAYGSGDEVKVSCQAGCENGSCPDCMRCEVCGGLGYLTLQAYGSDEMVKVACTAPRCLGGVTQKVAPGLPLEEVAAPAGTMLLVSPAEYTDGRVFLDEDSSSWMYATTGTFDMDAYIDRLCEEYDISLKRTNEVGECIFYDLDYRHIEKGSRHTLSLYTFSGGEKFELTVIKPSAGGISLPEFIDQPQEQTLRPQNVPDTILLLPSPAEYAGGKVYLDESSTSWMYSTTASFDMEGYTDLLCGEYGMALQDVSVVGDCVFYDLYYMNPMSGKQQVLCMYTFSGGSKEELSIIKPDEGVSLPEFYGQDAVTAKATPKPTKKPATSNRFENAMENYLITH